MNIDYEQLNNIDEELKKPLKNVRISSNKLDFQVDSLEERAILSRLDHSKFNPCLMSLESRT